MHIDCAYIMSVGATSLSRVQHCNTITPPWCQIDRPTLCFTTATTSISAARSRTLRCSERSVRCETIRSDLRVDWIGLDGWQRHDVERTALCKKKGVRFRKRNSWQRIFIYLWQFVPRRRFRSFYGNEIGKEIIANVGFVDCLSFHYFIVSTFFMNMIV